MARIAAQRPILVALLVLLLAACRSGNEQESQKGKEVKLGTITVADHGTKDVQGKSEVELEADSFYFSPSFLRGTPGQQLTLEVANESSDVHNFSLRPQAVDQDLPAKGKMTIAVTFPPSGTLWFFCKYHTSRGMNGELLAGDATPQPVSEQPPATPTAATGPGYRYP